MDRYTYIPLRNTASRMTNVLKAFTRLNSEQSTVKYVSFIYAIDLIVSAGKSMINSLLFYALLKRAERRIAGTHSEVVSGMPNEIINASHGISHVESIPRPADGNFSFWIFHIKLRYHIPCPLSPFNSHILRHDLIIHWNANISFGIYYYIHGWRQTRSNLHAIAPQLFHSYSNNQFTYLSKAMTINDVTQARNCIIIDTVSSAEWRTVMKLW